MTWVGPRAASCHLSLSFLLVEVSKTFNTKCDFVQCTTRTGGLPNKIRAVALRFHATLAAASMIYKPRKCAYNIGALPFWHSRLVDLMADGRSPTRSDEHCLFHVSVCSLVSRTTGCCSPTAPRTNPHISLCARGDTSEGGGMRWQRGTTQPHWAIHRTTRSTAFRVTGLTIVASSASCAAFATTSREHRCAFLCD